MFVPKFAFDLLKDAQESYSENGQFSDEILQALHDVFGHSIVQAAEFLEKGEVLQFETPQTTRRLLQVFDRHELYTLFPDINFCYCPVFQHRVLRQQNLITCKHVLAARLAKIRGKVKIERVTNSQFVDLMNDTIEYVKN